LFRQVIPGFFLIKIMSFRQACPCIFPYKSINI